MSVFKDKIVLITGGTGSIGSELVAQVLKHQPRRIRVFSRDESKQYELIEKMGYPKEVSCLIGDIRDKERLEFAFRGVDIVLHAAAMKHVSISEYNPFEVVKTNIVGSQNVIDAAIKQKVKQVVAISTDKAVNPSGILGTSKLMMEKLFVNAANYTNRAEIKFSCVRFGNVLWSRGSVLPSWQASVKKDNLIRVTDSGMTRFFMTKKDAIDLVLQSAEIAQGGEIFTFKMPSIKLIDLAIAFIEKYYPGQKIKIEIVGKRMGEKMYEELLDYSDLGKYIFTGGKLIIITPRTRYEVIDTPRPEYDGFQNVEAPESISSENSINKENISELI